MDGKIILVDKPAGMTSHDVVDRIRRIFKTRKVGHAGTLDPFATGLLIIGIGSATKELSKYVGLDKSYIATAKLGATSTTEDPEGEITERNGFNIPEAADIEKALDKFRGGYLQTASAFSAKKVGGKKLYDLARSGKLEGVEIPKKQVEITELKALRNEWPFLELEVACSSGTYIRALARDIGEALGCGAYLTELRRTRIGEYSIQDAKRLEEISETS